MNYSAHAAIWDWGGIDRTEDFEYWRRSAARYGSSILIPFCALGECGAYMARHGFEVTAFDITPEMIEEGKKRFGELDGLHLYEADVTNFHFDGLQADFCFIDGDFGHIHTLNGVKNALRCIFAALREGGGLVIETELPTDASSCTPPKTFYPKKRVYADRNVWKVGEGRTDAATGRRYISQTVYVEDDSGVVTQFDHSFYLQGYTRGEWLSALAECGFEVRCEYRGRGHAPWMNGDGELILEAVKHCNGWRKKQ